MTIRTRTMRLFVVPFTIWVMVLQVESAAVWWKLRQDRLQAGLCPDSTDDLCSSGKPETSRQSCKCDYACAHYGDCCVDAPRSPTRGEPAGSAAWVCHRSGFFALRSCPARWPPDDPVRRLCEGWEDAPIRTYLTDVPSFSVDSERMYWNMFCAACHGDAMRLTPWPASLDCDSAPLGGRGPGPVAIFDEHSLRQLVRLGNLTYTGSGRFFVTDRYERHACVLHLQPVGWKNFTQAHLLRSCAAGAEATPRCRYGPHELASKCAAYTAYVHDRVAQRNYRNYHCAICDVRQRQRLACGAFVDVQRVEGKLVSYGWTLNFPVWRPSADPSGECGSDDRMRDDLTGDCVPTGCAPGLVPTPGGRCVSPDNEILDPFEKPVPNCPLIRFDSEFLALLRNGSLLLNISGRGQVYALDQFRLVAQMNEQNRTVGWYAVACSGHRIPFIWEPTLLLVSRLCLGISAVCLAVLLATRLFELHSRRHKMAACLAACALLSQVLLLVETHVTPFGRGCAVLGLVAHYWHLACLAWTAAMAGDAYRALHALRNTRPDGRSIRQIGLLCWLAPGAIVAGAGALDRLQPDSTVRPLYGEPLCFLNGTLGAALFLVSPAAAVLVGAATLLGLVAPRLCGPPPQTKPARAEFRADRIRFISIATLVSLALLTWMAAVLAVGLQVPALWYGFTTGLAAQGMFALVAFAPLGRLAARLRGTRSAGVLVASASSGHLPEAVAASTVDAGPYRKHLAQLQESPTRRKSSCKPNLERRFSNKRPLVIEDEINNA
ncbi:unnamed protein product [Ixodes persulcatus]